MVSLNLDLQWTMDRESIGSRRVDTRVGLIAAAGGVEKCGLQLFNSSGC